MKIPNSQASCSLRFANVIPRAKMQRLGITFVLHPLPPKSSQDRVNLFDKSLREEDILHVIDRNGCKHRVDVSEPTSMIQLV